MKPKAILVDVGRHVVRFGLLQEGGAISQWRTVRRNPDERTTFVDFLKRHLKDYRKDRPILAIAAPGPYADDAFIPLGMKQGWQFSWKTIEDALEMPTVIVHDVLAAVRALATLTPDDYTLLPGDPHPEFVGTTKKAPRLYIQTGAGLGLAALLPSEGPEGFPFSGEGGSSSLAPISGGSCGDDLTSIYKMIEKESAAQLKAKDDRENNWGFPSAEHILSGYTLPTYYTALGLPAPKKNAPEDVTQAYLNNDLNAKRVMAAFSAFLGTFAADKALTFRAYAGVYIAGPIPRLLKEDERDVFREYFLARGKSSPQLHGIDVALISDQYMALRGLRQMLATMPNGQG